ncbi:MAG TPA: HAMP domain-containing sensor histidine kinase [Pyrinomonadaceae bacterium]
MNDRLLSFIAAALVCHLSLPRSTVADSIVYNMGVRSGRRKSIAFFVTFGACLVALAIALNVGWVLLNWRQLALLILGLIFFIAIISGLVLNTIFLVREIRRNEQHDAFINAVTHELKTPLASIRLYLETLQTREVDEARRREFYGIMLEDSNRLLQTVEQVLRAGRTGDRHRQLNRSVIDFGELARESIELARTRYNLANGSLSYTETVPQGERLMVLGDTDELHTMVSNLLDNAVKYSDKEVLITAEVSAIDRHHAALRISDRGIGIPRPQLKRIFRRFYRAPGLFANRIKGTGLGLFIVRSIVKKHGGRVFAESDGEGCGSTFTIQLPRTRKR